MTDFKHTAQTTLPAALDLLRALLPPTTLIHAGAGKGIGPLHVWHNWQIPNVHIVEANPNRLEWIRSSTPASSEWTIHENVLAMKDGKCTWHQTSYSDEDGLVAPSTLRSIWPHLVEKQIREEPGITLDQLVFDSGAAGENDSNFTWLFLDFLPALKILQGGPHTIDQCSVVCVRALLRDDAEILQEAGLPALERWLAQKGFRQLLIAESNHPALGHALFARISTQNESTELQTLLNAREATALQLQARYDSLQNEFAEAQRNLTAKEAALSQLQDQYEFLQSELAKVQQYLTAAEATEHQQAAELEAARQQIEQLEASLRTKEDDSAREREERKKLTSSIQTQIDQFARELAETAKSNDDKDAEIQRLNVTLDSLRAQIANISFENELLATELTKMQTRVVEADKLVSDANKKVESMQAEVVSRDARQQLLNDEIARAEAQVDFIKDVLFRESGL